MDRAIMRIAILIFVLSGNLLFATNISNLLLDIQYNNKIDLNKHNLHQGYNSKEQAFIAIGESFFDFNKGTFLEDKRKFSLVAFINAKNDISKFLSSKINAKDKLIFDNNFKQKSQREIINNNLLKNSFGIFQEEKLYNNRYVIKNYVLWIKDLSLFHSRSKQSINKYLNNTDISNMIGNRVIFDNYGRLNLIYFSVYKLSGNMWTDRITSKGLAQKDLVSMLYSNIDSYEYLEKNQNLILDYISKQTQKLDNISIKGMNILTQKKFISRYSNEKYLLTVSSYEVGGL
jgi:hypothetical protein